MTELTTTLTAEQAQALREEVAAFERHVAYEAALARNEVYLAAEPVVNSEHFSILLELVSELRTNGPEDDGFFGNVINAIYNSMSSLAVQTANWTTPLDPDTPVVAPPTIVETDADTGTV